LYFNLVSNAEGEFSFILASTDIRGPRNVTISPSKTSASVLHKFTYNEKEVESFQVYIDFLSFDKSVTITDITSVNFIGTVSIAETSEFNNDEACPVENATVCAVSILSGESLECDQTDKFGTCTQAQLAILQC
jgi:hypothetical protein